MKFAYLNFENHPRGNRMLQVLLEKGFYPELVIEERSDDAVNGRLEQIGFLGSFADRDEKNADQLCAAHAIQLEKVSSHNNDECLALLKALDLDYIVLGDTRILKDPVIGMAKMGVVNVHPGFLPEMRGNNPYIWAQALKLTQGATVHFIDSGVDTGPIILKRALDMQGINSVDCLVSGLNNLCAELLPEALSALKTNEVRLEAQNAEEFPIFRKAPKAVVEHCMNLLARAGN